MINKLRDEAFIKKILLIFLMIQPFLDCYLLYTDDIINLFHFSPTTIFRFLIIGVLFLLIFFNKNSKGNRKTIYIYSIFILLYIVLHHFTVYNYGKISVSNFEYSLITEMFYFLRMILPLVVAYLIYRLKPTKEEFINLFLIVTFITSSIIIVMNLFNISLASYGENQVIAGNLFSWFSSNRPASDLLASKGWFNSANQISGLFTLLLPIAIYSVLEKFNYKRIIVLCFCLLAMLMLGTRVSTVGWILIFATIIICYLFFTLFLKKENFILKNFITTLIIGAIFGILFLFSPLVNISIGGGFDEDALNKYLEENSLAIEDLSTTEYLSFLNVKEVFFKKLYPYDDHKKFWNDVAYVIPYSQVTGSRNVQLLITKDIDKEIKNKTAPLFGLGYSRFKDAKIYVEEDFVVQYYTIGIIGILLFIAPYLLIILYRLYQMFFVNRKSFNFYNIILVSMLVLPLAVSILSGHILDELIVSLYMGTVAGYILILIKNDYKNNCKTKE